MATGSVPIKETVYQGPAVETVYRGPGASPEPSVAASNTVYDATQHQGRPANSFGHIASSPVDARQGATPEVKRAAIRLFIIAALSLFQFIAFRESRPDTAIGGLLVAVTFCVLGTFAMRMSKAAFIIGLVLYGLDTLMLLFAGINSDLSAVAWPVIIHGIFLYRLWAGYQSIRDIA